MAGRLDLSDPVTALPGVGARLAELLAEHLGVRTVADLLAHYPSQEPGKYRERAAVKPLGEARIGETLTVIGRIEGWHAFTPRRRRGGKGPKHIARATVRDEGDGQAIAAPFFNQPWLPGRHPQGARVAVTGRLERYRGELQLRSARLTPLAHDAPAGDAAGAGNGASADAAGAGDAAAGDAAADDADGGLLATYPATAALPSERIARLVRTALELLPPLPDPLPAALRQRHGLVCRDTALRHIHVPPDREAVRRARDRLVYDELLALQLAIQQRRSEREQDARGLAQPPAPDGWAAGLLAGLPFAPTGAQRHAIAELHADLGAAGPMHRLLQGDVGSGKTLVAAWAMLAAVDHGRQAALMAPTEVLAEQHHRTLQALLAPLGVGAPGGPRVELVTGSLPARQLRGLLAEVAAGEVDVLVGTHALLEQRVAPPDLGLVVVDEQHRFGVEHRIRLRDKRDDGHHPDVLVMTATPIPRSLALTLYGDLDVTTLDELPPGRQPVTTTVLRSDSPRRANLERFVRERAAEGERAFWVCPAVDASEVATVPGPEGERSIASAVETADHLAQGPFADLAVGLVHGRLSAAEREAVMDDFRRGALDVLVATTVVEVGVDVPEATVMVVEDADRFGISQLHQLRGRVGRGRARSHCVLFAAEPEGNRRLEALSATTDGFALAETDLELRGEGSLFDTRQSGLADLRLARLVRDGAWVARAREDARRLLADDPVLADHPELHAVVRGHVDPERLAALDSG